MNEDYKLLVQELKSKLNEDFTITPVFNKRIINALESMGKSLTEATKALEVFNEYVKRTWDDIEEDY